MLIEHDTKPAVLVRSSQKQCVLGPAPPNKVHLGAVTRENCATCVSAGPGGDTGGQGTYLTLRRLQLWLAEPLRRMRLLAALVDAADGCIGGDLAGRVWAASKVGDPVARAYATRLLQQVGILDAYLLRCCSAGYCTTVSPSQHQTGPAALAVTCVLVSLAAYNAVLCALQVCVPLFDMIRHWVFDGQLEDPACEFFIVSHTQSVGGSSAGGGGGQQQPSGERDLWRDAYRLEPAKLPPFITQV